MARADDGAGYVDGTRRSVKRQECTFQVTSLTPRLISVVELVKREYLKNLDSSFASQGTLSGLHQYNTLGSVIDDAPASSREAERESQLRYALTGKN